MARSPRIEVRVPTEADGRYLIDHLREADRLEVEATLGDACPYAAMELVLSRCSHVWAVFAEDRLLMIGGLVPVGSLLTTNEAEPWILGTADLDRLPGVLTRVALRYLAVMKGHYRRLSNHVDARNVKSIRWLKRLGFKVHPQTVPFGPYGMPFHLFEMDL
ncbi:hypothetical protein [Cupriavidus sp. 2SB]|uniref:hypothetical protein n=1 Tax=Cupriavidus sp. 2SB TaxID=2502199 RepID=UPI0010F6CA1B|nr:hypothetical protein [Cupriavidus sp. 2SB]